MPSRNQSLRRVLNSGLLLILATAALAGCGAPSTPIIAPTPSASPTQPVPSPAATQTVVPQDTPTSARQDQVIHPIILTSPAFEPGGSIPAKYTCSGENISPELNWTPAPAGTKSLALIMDDPDAPNGTWVHWVLYNLPPETLSLPEGASKANQRGANLPAGSQQGLTSFGRPGYGGPCPPSGQHHYIFHFFALDTLIPQEGLDKAGLVKAMDGHLIVGAQLIGVYQK